MIGHRRKAARGMEIRIVGLWLFALCAGLSAAQAGPREVPPAAFRGAQYIDSRGCVFARVTTGGRVAWIARIDGRREPLCGYAPSFSRPAVATPVPPRAAPEVVRLAPMVPPGYKRAWQDGRLNPRRGIGSALGQTQQDGVWTRDVPQRPVGASAR